MKDVRASRIVRSTASRSVGELPSYQISAFLWRRFLVENRFCSLFSLIFVLVVPSQGYTSADNHRRPHLNLVTALVVLAETSGRSMDVERAIREIR